MSIVLGRKTYVRPGCEVFYWKFVPEAQSVVRVGNYCSIAENAKFFVDGNHQMHFASTFPFKELSGQGSGGVGCGKGAPSLGHDVWLGMGVTVMSGIRIGNGSVIAANSVVTKDVPDYALVGGNPARFIRWRFPLDIIERFQEVKWWDFDEDFVDKELVPVQADVDEWLLRCEAATVQTDAQILRMVKPFTMVSEKRLMNVLYCVEAVVKLGIPGDLVEVGVWKGGVIMAMALKCKQLGVERTIHAYDTFEGMTQPSSVDVDVHGLSAIRILPTVMCCSAFEETKANIDRTRYGKVVYHKGDILKTDLQEIPANIALLRLDTDWYESTKFELDHFEPRVSKSGVVIVDDYGHWKGCQKAVDEFLVGNTAKPIGIDYTGIWWNKE